MRYKCHLLFLFESLCVCVPDSHSTSSILVSASLPHPLSAPYSFDHHTLAYSLL